MRAGSSLPLSACVSFGREAGPKYAQCNGQASRARLCHGSSVSFRFWEAI